MNMFNKKVLALAVAGAAAGLSASASAVYINNDGTGQALVYPYYTTRNGQVTLMSVVNSTDQAKIVKVRVMEGKNSAEVLDFNLFLSPYDVWTAAIAPASLQSFFGVLTPTVGGSALYTVDRSCTNPTFADKPNGVAFRNVEYLTDPAANRTLDRTNEGYIEVLEMAEIVSGSTLWNDVKHNSANNFVPSCKLVNDASVQANIGSLRRVQGGLFGSGSIINPALGTNNAYNATAWSDWNDQVLYTPPSSTDPKISRNNSTGQHVAVVPIGSNVYLSTFAQNRDAVSATMMAFSVMNEYSHLDSGNNSTDWVLTMPTKRFYTQTSPALRPFQSPWNGSTSRDDFGVRDFDREEFSATTVTSDDFSPLPVGTSQDCSATAGGGANPLLTTVASLCYEANVLGFGKILNNTATDSRSNVLNSKNFFNLVNAVQNQGLAVPSPETRAAGQIGGWATITFPPTGALGSASYHTLPAPNSQVINLAAAAPAATATSVTYYGLPVIGFAVTQIKQGTSGINYAASYAHRYTRSITDPRAIQ